MNTKSGPMIIGHRGASYDAPENTPAAIRLAVEQGADGVEVDVQLTKDKQLVVIHDENTKRLSGVDLNLNTSSFGQLKDIPVGLHMGKEWANERIPLLEHVLQFIPTDKIILIEIKGNLETWQAVRSFIIGHYHEMKRIIFISFHEEILSRIKSAYPEIRVLLVAECGYSQDEIDKLITSARQKRFDGLDLSFNRKLTKEIAGKIHSEELLFFVWTVDDPGDTEYLQSIGVDAITSNRPGYLLDIIKQ